MTANCSKERRFAGAGPSPRSLGRERPAFAGKDGDGASTRVMPLEQMLAAIERQRRKRQSQATAPAVAPRHSARRAPERPPSRADDDDAETRVMRRPLVPEPRARAAVASSSRLSSIVHVWASSLAPSQWRRLSRRRSALMVLALTVPLILVRSFFGGPPPAAANAVGGSEPPEVELGTARPVVARAEPPATATAPAERSPARASSEQTATEREPLPLALEALAAKLEGVAPSLPAASLPPAASPPSSRTKSSKPASSRRGERAPDKTLERRAIDALAAGDPERSLQLYQQLATEQPDVSAYAEAYRILLASRAAL